MRKEVAKSAVAGDPMMVCRRLPVVDGGAMVVEGEGRERERESNRREWKGYEGKMIYI